MSEKTISSFTSRDMLFLPSMQQARIVAGKTGMSLPIYRIIVRDGIPDLDELKPGDFLLFSADLPAEQVPKLAQMIPQLSEEKLGGLAVAPTDVVRNTCEQVCDECGFPLIYLQDDHVLTEIFNEALGRIYEARREAFERAQDILEMIVDVFSRNQPVEQIVHLISRKLNQNVILLIDEDQVVSDDIISDSRLFLQVNKDALEAGGMHTLKFNEREVTAYICESKEPRRIRTIFLQQTDILNHEQVYLMNKVTQLVSIGLRNMQVIWEITHLYQDRFLHAWIGGEYRTRADLINASRSYDVILEPEDTCQVMIADTFSPEEPLSFGEIDLLELRRQLFKLSPSIFVTCYDKLAIIIRYDAKSVYKPTLFEQIRELLCTFLHKDICLSVSVRDSLEKLPYLHAEAVNIHRICGKIDSRLPIMSYQDLGVYAILALLPDDGLITRFQHRMLDPVYEYDKAHDTKLMETLMVYYANDCNAKLTAKKTFSHYNTVLYRLARLKEILDLDIDDPEVKLQIQLALKIETVME